MHRHYRANKNSSNVCQQIFTYFNINMLTLPSVCISAYSYLKVDEPAVYKPQDLPHGSVYSLDSHHSHFLLVEEDPNRPGATSEMRVKLLKHISLQRTGYGGKALWVTAGNQ